MAELSSDFVEQVCMSGRILIIDDIPTNRALLKAKLTSAFFEVETADRAADVVNLAQELQPDLILLDVTDCEDGSLGICRLLKSGSDTAHIPVVVITEANATAIRVAALEAGADDFLCKPFDTLTVVARVRSLMRVKLMIDEMRLRDDTSRELGLHSFLEHPSDSEITGNVLISGGSKAEAREWAEILAQNSGVRVSMASGLAETIQAARESAPDVIVLAQQQSDQSLGRETLSTLLALWTARQAAIIFVVGQDQGASAATALDMGANDYIAAPFEASELNVRIRSQLRRKRYADRLRSNVVDGLKMAVIDPLTGLYNRRYALQHLKSISERATEDGSAFSILMMDVDEFKVVNDLYGHSAGDAVLSEISRRLQESLRGIDLIARIGGEEFFVAMPGTSADQAACVAERLREAIETRPFTAGESNLRLSITLSIGVASSDAGGVSPEAVMQNADLALYSAKSEGRNAVKVFSVAA